MISDDDWRNFHFAAKDIKAKLGVSLGKAQAMLRQACASGEVRSQKQPCTTINVGTINEALQTEGPPERIEPSEWRNREIDLMIDANGCWHSVDVHRDDFGYWLNNQHQPKSEQGKQPLVMQYLAEMFPRQRVPDPAHYQRKALLAELRRRNPILNSLDIKTLGRAINKYNLRFGGSMGNECNPTLSN